MSSLPCVSDHKDLWLSKSDLFKSVIAIPSEIVVNLVFKQTPAASIFTNIT